MDSREIVAAARDNFRRAIEQSHTAALPDPGGRWSNYCSQARITIDRFDRAEDVIHYVQSANTGFESRSTGDALAQQCKALEEVCEQLFPEFAHTIPSFAETPLSTPETLMQLRGRIVSAPLLWHMRIIMAIVNLYRPESVLEIGGGFGAPGRAWMTNKLMPLTMRPAGGHPNASMASFDRNRERNPTHVGAIRATLSESLNSEEKPRR